MNITLRARGMRLRHRFGKLAASSLATLPILFGLAPAQVFAGTNTIGLNSSAGTVTKDGIFTITVVLNAQDPIDVAQAYVTWDTSKVSYQSADYGGTAFGNDTGDTVAGSGYYQSSRFRTPPFTTGSLTLVRLSFQAIASSGSAAFGVTGANSFAYSGGTNFLTSVTGVSVNLTAPVSNTPPPAGTTVQTSGGSGTGASTVVSTPAATSGNNGTPTETVAVTEEEAVNAANTTTDRMIELANAPAETVGTTANTAKKKLPLVPMMALSVVVLLAGAAFVYLRFIAGRRTNASVAASPIVGTTASPSVDELASLSGGSVPNSGDVIAPNDDSSTPKFQG